VRRQLFQIEIAKPCSENWAEMRGDARARYCEACEKVVQDFSHLNDRQVEQLAMRAAAGESICARLTRGSDGELVTLGPAPARTGRIAQGALLAGAFAVGVPAAAQGLTRGVQRQEDVQVALKEVAPEPQLIPGMAVVIGRLLHPDGRRVDTGLVYVQDAQGVGPLYVVDESGWFEIHTPPGIYNFVVRTGADQIERVPGVVLHEGVQVFADIRTRSGPQVPDEIETTTGGTLAVHVGWGWHAFRHPILYARYLARKML
jgi:hypothetical protein